MEEIKMPKGYKLSVRCYQQDDSQMSHVILTKEVNSETRYFLFEVDNNEVGKQITTSKTPQKLYSIIWPNHEA